MVYSLVVFPDGEERQMHKMEEKKKQEFQADENFEIEDSNVLKVLKAKGEEDSNPHESHLPQKKVSKIENFIYLHKWHLGIGIFVGVLAIVLICQIIFHVPADVYILYTGPQAMVGRDYEKLEDAFQAVMDDYNGDGHKELNFADNTFLTEKEIERRRALNPKYKYDVTANNGAYQRFMTEITSGIYMFCMLDPDLHAGLREQEAFVPLTDIFDEIPECAEDDYGIRLGDTEFYRSNGDIQYIPANTVLAVRVPSTLDIKSEEKKAELLEYHKALLRSIVEYTPEEE